MTLGKKIGLLTLAIFSLFFVSILFVPLIGLAQEAENPDTETDSSAAGQAIQLLDETAQQAKIITSPQTAPTIYKIIGDVINIILGFLGVIFLLLIIYGGITWMRGGTMVGGGATKVDINKAKQIITQATIGLIIVLFAFLFTNFVVFRIIDVVMSS